VPPEPRNGEDRHDEQIADESDYDHHAETICKDAAGCTSWSAECAVTSEW
jgi:hypothetical protein